MGEGFNWEKNSFEHSLTVGASFAFVSDLLVDEPPLVQDPGVVISGIPGGVAGGVPQVAPGKVVDLAIVGRSSIPVEKKALNIFLQVAGCSSSRQYCVFASAWHQVSHSVAVGWRPSLMFQLRSVMVTSQDVTNFMAKGVA